MPRAGVSAGRFDYGWDWIDPQQDGDPAAGGDARDPRAYYDWSQTGEFREPTRARARPRSRALRAVPDAGPHPRPLRAPRRESTEPPARAARIERDEDPVRPPRPVAAAPVRIPRPVAAAPARAPRPVAAAPTRAPMLSAEPIDTAPPPNPVAVRRTVTITGRGAEGHLPSSPRRPAKRPYERAGFQPDRIAMWAVLLGVLMILAAATSAHAALLHP